MRLPRLSDQSSRLRVPLLVVAALVVVGSAAPAMAQSDDLARPSAPVNVRVVSVGNTSVDIAWDVGAAEEGQVDPDSYRVYFREAAPEPGSQPIVARWWYYWRVSEVAANRRQATVPRLTRGVWYELTVVAMHEAGDVWSDEAVSVRPGSNGAAEQLPGAPSKVSVVAEGPGSATVVWESPTDGGGAPVTGYEVWHISRQEYQTDNADEATAVVWTKSGEVLGSEARQHVIAGLVDFQEYYVIVAAVNRVGRGLFSDEIYALPGRDGVDPPDAPTNVRVLAERNGSVSVGWEPPPAEEGRATPTGYRVRYRRAATGTNSKPSVDNWSSVYADVSAREAELSDLANDVWYEINVIAAGGQSDQVVMARPSATGPPAERPPGAPSDLRTVSGGLGSVTVAWEAPVDNGGAPVTGYEVWYVPRQDWRTRGLYIMSGGTLGSEIRRHSISELVDYQRYRIVVAAVNAVGRGAFASEWSTANSDDLDPLGLIVDHRLARSHSLGTDTWQVWVCDVSDGGATLNMETIVTLLNREIPPYFSWISEGRYQPAFLVGGMVKADNGKSSERASDYECDEVVSDAPAGEADGALIVLNKANLVSNGGQGTYESSYVDHIWQVDPGRYPDNTREVQLTASTVLARSEYCDNCRFPEHINLDTVAHELGHALGWPHSFGGNRAETSEVLLEIGQEIDEYDNPMDLISGSPTVAHLGLNGLVAGTIAVNRYAAGWIDPDEVVVHDDQYGSYVLSPIGSTGTGMLVLPVGEPGHFISLGARVASGYDVGIPAEGVEVYRIDQRASACADPEDEAPADPDRLSCSRIDRRTQQVPPPPSGDQTVTELTDHVYGPGEGLTIEGFRVEVTERVGDRFKVWVGTPYTGSFADDEGSVHESNIEKLVELEVTVGCDTDLKLFCPDRSVTRAQMAAFLIRALKEQVAAGLGPSRFSDVPDDAWYRPHVVRLIQLGIMAGHPDGTFRPHEVVTRARMAVLMARAFDRITAVESPVGVFDDVASTAPEAGAVEGMLAADITHGCGKSPGRNYCPDAPVTRDQMATFLIRALS